jgi:hypothetical protein
MFVVLKHRKKYSKSRKLQFFMVRARNNERQGNNERMREREKERERYIDREINR